MSAMRAGRVIVRHRQQLCLAVGQPFPCRRPLALRAMPVAAGVVGDDGVRAVFTTLDVPAERCRATALDGRHHLQLLEADVSGIVRAPRRPVVAEDVRDLQLGAGHCGGLRRRLVRARRLRADELNLLSGLFALSAWLSQHVEWALDVGDHAGGNAGIARRRIELLVPE